MIATADDAAALVAALEELPVVESVQQSGPAGARATTHAGLKVDLKVVAPDQFGNVLQHFTGSKDHNVQLREAAVRKGLHVSEYGILDDATGETVRCATEEEVYATLGLPVHRAGAARGPRRARGGGSRARCPALVTLEDLRGDLHSHTTLSDGNQDIEEMAEGARKRGYEYLAITDHSATHGFGNHVDIPTLEQQIERVRALDATLGDDFELLIGTETNILPDGSLDYPDELLAELDWVVASVHTSFNMSADDMTARMIAAVEHPLVDVIGHPTGRKIETRAPYAVDMEQVIAAAAKAGTMLEINAAPDRRDLNELHARAAAQAGVLIVIDSDAHSVRNLELMRYGIATARRAWLTPEQVANTRPWAELARAAQAEPDRRVIADVPRGLRAGLPFALAGGVLAMSFGVLAGDVGMPGWTAILMSAIVFAGSAQIAALGIIGAGGALGAALGAAALMNSRFLPMGVAFAPSLPGGPLKRAPQGQTVVDVSLVVAEDGKGGFDRGLLFGSTAAQYAAWVHGHRSRACSPGPVLGDPQALGLDAIFPAFFLALLIGELRDARGRAASPSPAALIALALVPFTPPGVPVLAASAAAFYGMLRP